MAAGLLVTPPPPPTSTSTSTPAYSCLRLARVSKISSEHGETSAFLCYFSASLSPPPGSKLIEELDGSESRVVRRAAGVSVVSVSAACQLPTSPHLAAWAKRQVRERSLRQRCSEHLFIFMPLAAGWREHFKKKEGLALGNVMIEKAGQIR